MSPCPLPGEHPYDAFPCGFSLSTDAIEAGLRFSLHPVIEAYLEQWRISPSQMAPNSWRYLVAFLWECYVSGIRVTRELFMACFRLSREQAGYYLAIHSGFRVRCTFQQQRLEVTFFLHFLSPGLELPDQVDLSDGEQLRTGIIDRRDRTGRDPLGILSVSKGVKDMNEAWLGEVGLSPLGVCLLPFLYRARVFLNHTFCCAEMFNLGKIKSDNGAGSGLAAPSAASALATGDAGASTAEKRPSSGVGAGLRKRLRKVAAEQPADASGSTARTSADKGKGMVELEEVPKRGYTMRELYEVENRAGADKYFASIMTQLKCTNSEDPLVLRWLTISGSSVRLESDVLSLTEAAVFLEAELKAKGSLTSALLRTRSPFPMGRDQILWL
ncbi:hypothetical protein GW17_00034311 [Ensete ventricosum]|nr:hypothetical protein GW17_00034311 [Ensete ventricosum]